MCAKESTISTRGLFECMVQKVQRIEVGSIVWEKASCPQAIEKGLSSEGQALGSLQGPSQREDLAAVYTNPEHHRPGSE